MKAILLSLFVCVGAWAVPPTALWIYSPQINAPNVIASPQPTAWGFYVSPRNSLWSVTTKIYRWLAPLGAWQPYVTLHSSQSGQDSTILTTYGIYAAISVPNDPTWTVDWNAEYLCTDFLHGATYGWEYWGGVPPNGASWWAYLIVVDPTPSRQIIVFHAYGDGEEPWPSEVF